jgi:hypothetical protein
MPRAILGVYSLLINFHWHELVIRPERGELLDRPQPSDYCTICVASMKLANPKNRTCSLFVSNHGPYMAAWYKWEFLRRNSEYRSDYGRFLNSFGVWFKRKGFWYDTSRRAIWTSSDQSYYRAKIEPRIVRLCQKWQIFDLFPPESGLREARESNKISGRELHPPTGFPPESVRDYRFANGLSGQAFSGRTVSAKLNGSLLSVEFNLNWQVQDLLHYATRVIRFAHMSYRDELRKRGLKPSNGRRVFTDFDMHLKVWDLKQRVGSVATVAQLMFPGEEAMSACQRVRDHLKAAERLINGCGKEIR